METKASGSVSIDLPGRRLVTSKDPRMLTPSEIELLRQDLREALEVVGADEIEGAETLFRENGFKPEDFRIFQKGDVSPALPSSIKGIVIVVRRSSGAAKTYEAGSGSPWLLRLEADLKARVFGRPSE